jgi:hypothetical protein
MQAVLMIPSRGEGVFALRRALKVLKNTVCDLKRNPDNLNG